MVFWESGPSREQPTVGLKNWGSIGLRLQEQMQRCFQFHQKQEMTMRNCLQFLPYIQKLVAPWMDRFPRKPFLVFGDFINGIFYALMGIYLLFFDFSYVGYLGYSLLLATLGSLDELANERRIGTC